ncbi:MAG: TolC family protein [Bacteroidota bacterium]
MKQIYLIISFILVTVFANAQKSETLSLSMDEAVNFALSNSYAIKNAKLDIDWAEKKKWETTTMGLPQINAELGYQNFLKQGVTLIPAEIFGGEAGEFMEVTFGTKQNANATVKLEQLIFDGSYLVGLQSAKTFLKISNLGKEKTENTIREAVINAYGNVLLAEESIQILEKNRSSVEKNYLETVEIVKNGMAEEQDAEQLQITLSSLDNQLNKAQRFEIIARKMLNITLGIDINKDIILTDHLKELADRNTDLNLFNQSFNLDNHVDFKLADNNVRANELFVKLEKSRALPSINAFVNYSKFANNDNNIFFSNYDQKWFDSSLFGINMHIPIFSSLQRSSKTQQAKIALIQSQNDLDEISQKLKLQVASSKNKYQFSIDQYHTAKQNLALAERIEKKEQIKFFEGLSSSFNLTTAQNQLYDKQRDYLQSIIEIINTKVELENALNIK